MLIYNIFPGGGGGGIVAPVEESVPENGIVGTRATSDQVAYLAEINEFKPVHEQFLDENFPIGEIMGLYCSDKSIYISTNFRIQTWKR